MVVVVVHVRVGVVVHVRVVVVGVKLCPTRLAQVQSARIVALSDSCDAFAGAAKAAGMDGRILMELEIAVNTFGCLLGRYRRQPEPYLRLHYRGWRVPWLRYRDHGQGARCRRCFCM